MVQYRVRVSDNIFYRLCVTAILYWFAHFEDMASVERFPKPSAAVLGRAKQVLSYLKGCDNLLFLHFMCDVFNHLATLSKMFQKVDLTVCQAVESQEACFWELTSLRVDMGPQMAKVNQAIKESEKKYVCVIWID